MTTLYETIKNNAEKTAAPKLLSTFTFIYFCLLVYASLMPYDFTTDIPYHKILIQALNH
jgi:hypothetical protein